MKFSTPPLNCGSPAGMKTGPTPNRRQNRMTRDRYRAAPIFRRALYFGIGEGSLAEHLDAAVAQFPAVAIGSYPRFDDADYRVKVTFDGRDEDQVRRAAAFLRARIPPEAVLREE